MNMSVARAFQVIGSIATVFEIAYPQMYITSLRFLNLLQVTAVVVVVVKNARCKTRWPTVSGLGPYPLYSMPWLSNPDPEPNELFIVITSWPCPHMREVPTRGSPSVLL